MKKKKHSWVFMNSWGGGGKRGGFRVVEKERKTNAKSAHAPVFRLFFVDVVMLPLVLRVIACCLGQNRRDASDTSSLQNL